MNSQPRTLSLAEMVDTYLAQIPLVWSQVSSILNRFNVELIEDATAVDLKQAFATKDVVGLLAHHNDSLDSIANGIELFDGTLNMDSMIKIAPERPIIVHLGVCRSKRLIEAMKSRCGAVCVISSHAQVEPEFFLRIFARTVQLWQQEGGDYAQAHVRLRMAMLDELGTG